MGFVLEPLSLLTKLRITSAICLALACCRRITRTPAKRSAAGVSSWATTSRKRLRAWASPLIKRRLLRESAIKRTREPRTSLLALVEVKPSNMVNTSSTRASFKAITSNSSPSPESKDLIKRSISIILLA